jgi:hypothetical protein
MVRLLAIRPIAVKSKFRAYVYVKVREGTQNPLVYIESCAEFLIFVIHVDKPDT